MNRLSTLIITTIALFSTLTACDSEREREPAPTTATSPKTSECTITDVSDVTLAPTEFWTCCTGTSGPASGSCTDPWFVVDDHVVCPGGYAPVQCDDKEVCDEQDPTVCWHECAG